MSLTIQVREKQTGYFELALDGRLDTETHAQLETALQQPPLKAARGNSIIVPTR